MNDRENLIAKYIDELKAQVGADSDSDLARLLSVDKRTVSAWRSRQSIPQKFMSLLRGDTSPETSTPAMQMSELDRVAFALALVRFSRVQADTKKSGDFREAWNTFRSLMGFWMLMREARSDINTAVKDRASNLETAFTLVLHDDISAAEETIQRDRSVIAAAERAVGS